MTRILLLSLVTLIFLSSYAQNKTYIGIEASASGDVYDMMDNGSLIRKFHPLSGYFGISIRRDLGENVFLETGLLMKSYNEGIAFKPISSYSSSNAINTWLIPIRLGTRINLLNQKIQLVPVIGYAQGINIDYGYGDGGLGGFTSNIRDTVFFKMYSSLSLRKTFPLLQTGMGVEYMLFRTVLMSVSANYYTGFKNLMEQDIEYTYRSNTNTAAGISKGDMISFGLAFKYPFGGRKKVSPVNQ